MVAIGKVIKVVFFYTMLNSIPDTQWEVLFGWFIADKLRIFLLT